MQSRLKELRKTLKITQKKLAESLGISDSAISRIEKGENTLTDQNIKLICSEFNVNEQWLRTGEGEMFNKGNETLIHQLVEKYHLSDTGENILRLFCKLDPHSRGIVENFIVDVANAVNPAERVLYIARSGDQGETRITKDAQEEALRALDESSDPDL